MSTNVHRELADFHHRKGLDCHRAGRLSEARAAYDDALSYDPKRAEAYINRGAVRYQLNDTTGAFADYATALALKNSPTVHNNRGAMRRDLGDLSGALEDFDQAIRLHPCYAEAFENRASLHNFRWDHQQAVEDYTRALELHAAAGDKQGRTLLLRTFRGDSLYHLGRGEAALDDYRFVFALRPGFFVRVVYRTVMQSLRQHGEEKMLAECARHIAAPSENGLTFVRRAMILYLLGRTSAADADYRRCQELCPPADREMLEKVIAYGRERHFHGDDQRRAALHGATHEGSRFRRPLPPGH